MAQPSLQECSPTDPAGPATTCTLLTVDAFTAAPFAGNPAAVCILEGPAPEAWMRAVAREMNLSETAFLHPEADHWRLRWLTPVREVDLCGHATLASAHALWDTGRLGPDEPATFETRSGRLVCRRTPHGITMDLPATGAVPAPAPPGLWEALGIPECEVLRSPLDHILIVTDAATVRRAAPDFRALQRIGGVHGFALTAHASDGADYVCRYFAPAYGIDEDPVTGSIQTVLGPYWCKRLGKPEVLGRQVSARGGSFTVRPQGDRVRIAGQAVTVLRATLPAPTPFL